jgi:hypothetical protein
VSWLVIEHFAKLWVTWLTEACDEPIKKNDLVGLLLEVVEVQARINRTIFTDRHDSSERLEVRAELDRDLLLSNKLVLRLWGTTTSNDGRLRAPASNQNVWTNNRHNQTHAGKVVADVGPNGANNARCEAYHKQLRAHLANINGDVFCFKLLFVLCVMYYFMLWVFFFFFHCLGFFFYISTYVCVCVFLFCLGLVVQGLLCFGFF